MKKQSNRERQYEDSMRGIAWTFIIAIALFVVLVLCNLLIGT